MSPSRLHRSGRFSAPLLAAALTACGEPPPALEVAGIAYSREEILGLTPSRQESLRDLTALAAAVSRDEVVAVGAPLFRRQEADHLWERLQAERILREAAVSDENLAALYATNPEHELTVRHLIVMSARYETDEKRAEARAKAERALQRIRGGEPFPDVAAEVSEEPGAEGRQGLLEPGRRGAWVDEFWNAASALEVGGISGVVETQYGFHVLRLEGRGTVPFSEVRDRVAMEAARMMGTVESAADRAPLPEGFVLAAGLDTLGESGAVAATFQRGDITLDQLLDHAATLDARTWAAVRDGTGRARGVVAEAAARAEGVRAAAAAEDIEADPAWRAEAEEAWAAEVQRWADAFGFRSGMGAEGIKAAALAALSATGQLSQLTRDQVRDRRGLLERYYRGE